MFEVESLSQLNNVLIEADDNNKLVVADLYASWCGPCKFIAPLIHKLDEEYNDRVTFVKVDIQNEKAESLTDYFNVQSIPTLLFLKGSETLETLTGAKSEKVYRDTIDFLLEKYLLTGIPKEKED